MTDFLKREGREGVGTGRCRRESPSQPLSLKIGKLRPREAKPLAQCHSGRQSRTAVSASENSPPGERTEDRPDGRAGGPSLPFAVHAPVRTRYRRWVSKASRGGDQLGWPRRSS